MRLGEGSAGLACACQQPAVCAPPQSSEQRRSYRSSFSLVDSSPVRSNETAAAQRNRGQQPSRGRPVPANNQRFARRHNRASIAVGCYHAKAVVPGFFGSQVQKGSSANLEARRRPRRSYRSSFSLVDSSPVLLSRLIELARSRQERKSSDSSCVVAGELLDLRWSRRRPRRSYRSSFSLVDSSPVRSNETAAAQRNRGERSDPTANDGGQVETGQRLLLSRLLTRLAGAFNSRPRRSTAMMKMMTFCGGGSCCPRRGGEQQI
jgi:hypothetical protein